MTGEYNLSSLIRISVDAAVQVKQLKRCIT